VTDEQNPYQTPQAIELSHGYRIAPIAGRSAVPFASGRLLAWVAMVLVALVILASLGVAASSAMQIGLFERAARGVSPSVGEARSNDIRQNAAIALRQVVYMISGVTFLIWFYRAYRNLSALGNTRLSHMPSGAVGWWFVPIASLVVPCQIALEIWNGRTPAPTEPRLSAFLDKISAPNPPAGNPPFAPPADRP